jgi:membrane protein
VSIATRAKAIVATGQDSGFGKLIRRCIDDRADLLATIVAFNVLFAMFPIILGVLAIVGLVFRDPVAQARARDLILSTVPADGALSVLQAINGASHSAGLFGLLSLVGILWGGFSLFGALEVALDRVYRTPSRPLVGQILMSVGMMVLFALLVSTVLLATTATQLVGRLVGPEVAPPASVAGGVISFLAAFALCFTIYYIVPNARLTAGQVLPGALFASVALVLLTQLLPLYALYVSGVSPYGAVVGLFFLLMTWAYLLGESLLIGAEINALFRPAATALRASSAAPAADRALPG